MYKSDLVNAELALGLKEATQELGLNIKPRLSRFDLSPTLLHKPEGFMSWSKFNQLLEITAVEERCLHLGLLVGKYQPAMRLGALTQLLKLCPDIRTALDKAQRYNNIYNQTVYWDLKIKQGFVILSRNQYDTQDNRFGQVATLSIVQVHKLLTELSNKQWKPSAISFVHACQNSKIRQQYCDLFKVPVSFSQETDSIIFREQDLDIRIDTADLELLKIVENHVQTLQSQLASNNNIIKNVKTIIRQHLGSNLCNIIDTAKFMNLHPKNLQRELSEQGTTFKLLLTEERIKLAQQYLCKSDIQLNQLAEILGYSDASALSRAFKKYCGISPSEWKLLHE